MIANWIEVSITKKYIKKPSIHRGEYEWADARAIISNYWPTIIHLLLKSINPDTKIDVSNPKYKIDKENLIKFGNNVKDLLDDLSSNYSIIIDKG